MDTTLSPGPVLVEIRRRVCAYWLLKFVGVPASIALFFAGYFLLLKYPVFAVTSMPVTALDRAIPFQPATLGLYFSLWFYVSIPSALLGDRAELLFHARSAAMLGFAGLAIFFFWPTTVVRELGTGMGAAPGLDWLRNVDAAGNACPSLHVAFAIFGGWWIDRVLREVRAPLIVRVLNAGWCLGIVYSTLSTKQHVVVDVVAGVALGLAAGLMKPRPRRVSAEQAAS